jgi:type II secretion system protein N
VASEAGRTALPRTLLAIGVPVAGILLVSFFIYLGFPYDKLADRIKFETRRSGAARLDFQDVGPSLHLAGPGIEATGVRATLSNGETFRLERAMLRPAWSLAWFRGSPAVYTEIESEAGNAAGTVILGDGGGYRGSLEKVDIGKLPLTRFESMGTLDGVLDASVDILLGDQGPLGSVTFEARDGSIGLADFPMQLPFEKLSGELLFGDDAYVAVKRLALEGPILSAEVTGNVLRAASFSEAPLQLEVEIEAKPAISSAIRSAGIRVGRNGKAKARITGTVAKPSVR